MNPLKIEFQVKIVLRQRPLGDALLNRASFVSCAERTVCDSLLLFNPFSISFHLTGALFHFNSPCWIYPVFI